MLARIQDIKEKRDSGRHAVFSDFENPNRTLLVEQRVQQKVTTNTKMNKHVLLVEFYQEFSTSHASLKCVTFFVLFCYILRLCSVPIHINYKRRLFIT